ncbi:MAG: hypothetical protein KGL48_14835 [Sphingomonadales bacterium]|nr:hypothetical protein [Sphingomonadales bacterium]MDE2568911.1 hypothetical protein [Sphingomonadales bacterium]
MFIGHWAPALAAATHRRAPKLGTLFVAAQLVDWLFFAFLLTGAEHMRMVPGFTAMNPMDLYDMPYTHSLMGSLFWSVLFGALVWTATKDRAAGLIAGVVVFSHWLLDLLVHAPDLTIAGSPPKFGLGLWNYPSIEMPLEVGITLAALVFYRARMRPSDLRVAVLAAVLLVLQAVNWFGGEASEVTAGTSLLAFFAYGLATLAAWWTGKSARPVRKPL